MNNGKPVARYFTLLQTFGLITICSLLTGCVIPYIEDNITLTVTPHQIAYPLYYEFVYTEELEVVYTDGWDAVSIPPQSTTLDFNNNFGSTGTKTGTCEYRGKTASFSVYVYNPSDPDDSGAWNGDGPSIVINPRPR